MLNLIIQFYKIKYKNVEQDLINKRQQEINFCFINNLMNKNIDKIHFLYELQEDVEYMKLLLRKNNIETDKIILYNLAKRMNYKDLFNYANNYDNRNLLNNPTWIYAHSDMLLNSGFDLLNKTNFNNKNIYTLTAHKSSCNKQLICNCTRQFKTNDGYYTPTMDGFVFKTPILPKAVKDCDHVVHIMGAENRLVAMLKTNGYKVLCPNNILHCYHIHDIKIFANEHSKWIQFDGTTKELSYYQNIHKNQKHKEFKDRIVGGGIPFFLGSVKIIDRL